jgi:hypothetical protein
VQAVAELLDAGRNFIELDGLAPAVSFYNKHSLVEYR